MPNFPIIIHLVREQDPTGVSGIGNVADGVVTPRGKVVLWWNSEVTSVAVYDSLEDVMKIHGHNGQTVYHTHNALNCSHCDW